MATFLPGLAPVLLLVSPLIEALGTLGIPLFVAPSLLLAAWLAGIGSILGVLLVATQPRVDRAPRRELAFAVTLAVDEALGIHGLRRAPGGEVWPNGSVRPWSDMASASTTRLSVVIPAP